MAIDLAKLTRIVALQFERHAVGLLPDTFTAQIFQVLVCDSVQVRVYNEHSTRDQFSAKFI